MQVVPSPSADPPAFWFAVARSDTSRVSLAATGELDLAAVEDLAALMALHEAAGRTFFRFDLSGVTFMDCSCLGVLVGPSPPEPAAGSADPDRRQRSGRPTARCHRPGYQAPGHERAGEPVGRCFRMSLAPANERFVSRYTDLAREVRDAGLMQRSYLYYWTEMSVAVAAFGGIWVAFAFLGNSWFQLLLAAALGIVVTQFGFLGHDAAHRQMFESAAWNTWTARVLAGAFAGLSFSWWRTKHNLHHKGPNRDRSDPDIAPGAISFTPDVVDARAGFSGWLAHRQGWFFFPLLTLEGINLHISSVRATLDRTSRDPWRRLELGVIVVRLSAYVAVLFFFLPIGLAAAFLAIQLAVFGFCLGAAFAPAHKGMPIVPATMRLDFLRRQVMASRNVYGNPLVDFFMGGLNYQIEHHLFPSMPRCNLKHARGLVRTHCERAGIDYMEVGLFRSYAIVVGYLNNVGLRARDPFDCPLSAELRSGSSDAVSRPTLVPESR